MDVFPLRDGPFSFNRRRIINLYQKSFILHHRYPHLRSRGGLLNEGKGFFISKEGDVITNRHLLEGASRVEIKTVDGMLYPVTKVVAEDKEANLIRVSVEIPSRPVHPLPISAFLPQLGERVMVIGELKT